MAQRLARSFSSKPLARSQTFNGRLFGAPEEAWVSKQVIACIAVVLAEATYNSVMYPILPFMVEDLLLPGPTSDAIITFNTGLLAATFCLGQLFSLILWGHLWEVIGRKNVILLGLCGNAVTACLFATSSSYTWALIFRFIGGLLNCSLFVVRSYALEVLEGNDRVRAFKCLGIIWSLGVMLGPEIGGLLSRPNTHIPILFAQGAFWEMYPYLLPIILVAVATLVVVGIVMVYLPPVATVRKVKFKNESDKELNLTLVLALSVGVFTSFTDLFPLWAKANESQGGLELTDPFTIGQIQSFGSLVAVLVQCSLLNSENDILIIKATWAIFVPIICLFPFAQEISLYFTWPFLAALYSCFSITQMLVLSRLYLALTHESWSTLSSSAHYFTAISKTLFTFLFSSALAWSYDHPFPFDFHLPYFVLAVVGLVCVVLIYPAKQAKKGTETQAMHQFLLDEYNSKA
mmetsp:Transcript_34113/g.59508  ORF Transcript_34113/g.59508 Transcript_34113/m.59508 type:complete len:461 (+) Transcript_34113:1475-2857(+)|eukprot:CAMPEP_0204908962 /NCGR_PEP_ID=MMETSP1397-20131031/7793_1 /ASSEMBLY_ACC=CAM_ASM_000891 /TAXON_ID=49980 /ORGANISM="Climacostomum Climacostomum virens, Strain Stock W-24" /LENGTH=460 /DNA_ID=CAMNT_0052078669 /DNA_START=272 /DNA_END=1654 /DNA_ORIENTATION=+